MCKKYLLELAYLILHHRERILTQPQNHSHSWWAVRPRSSPTFNRLPNTFLLMKPGSRNPGAPWWAGKVPGQNNVLPKGYAWKGQGEVSRLPSESRGDASRLRCRNRGCFACCFEPQWSFLLPQLPFVIGGLVSCSRAQRHKVETPPWSWDGPDHNGRKEPLILAFAQA